MATEYFQSVDYKNFRDIEGTVVYIDDILIAANSEEEHGLILDKIMHDKLSLKTMLHSAWEGGMHGVLFQFQRCHCY